MNSAGGERGNRLTLFATGYWLVVGTLVAAKEPNGMPVGLTRNALIRDLKQAMGAGTFIYACGGLGASGALTSAFKGGEPRGLTKFNCPSMPDLRGNW